MSNLHVARLGLRNWMPFELVDLHLGPKAYAVEARLEGDPERSNYLGKSALADSVMFALTGWLSPDRKLDDADSWIRRGQPAGGVLLTLSDGSSVERSRTRGRSTQLTYISPAGEVAKQDRAQELVYDLIGLSEVDMLATCFCAQGGAGFLVQAREGDLTEVFGSWLRLGALERAEERLLRASEGHRQEAERVSALMRREDDPTGAGTQLPGLAREKDDLQARADGLMQRIDLSRRQAAARAVVPEYEALQAEGRKLRAEYDAMDHASRRAAEEKAALDATMARAHHQKFREDTDRARRLVAGTFDGQCPVGNMPCPVSADLLAQKARNKQNLATAQEAEAASEKRVDAAQWVHREASASLGEASRVEQRLEAMRAQLEKMFPRYSEAADMPVPEATGPLETELRQVQADLHAARDRWSVAEAWARRAREHEAARERHEAALKDAQAREALSAAAAGCVRSARRGVAEQALAEIEDGANEDLAACGTTVRVHLRWQREGKGLSRACDACGRPFPDSARVKECACGAKRGPLMVQRLGVQLSERSGGSAQLAGVALQLAAGRWLRAERGAAWGVCALDEVAGALDASNRRGLTAHLPRMLSAAGFSQAFVVSHDPRASAALPARIVVTSDGKVSRAEVAG